MGLNKAAAAYLAYFSYVDDALDTVDPQDFMTCLNSVPKGAWFESGLHEPLG